MKPLVYVAGPYSADPHRCTSDALSVATYFWDTGACIPVLPHLTHFWDRIHPHPYEEWMEMDFELLRRCDALWRIPGESSGADREIQFADEHGIPTFGAHLLQDEGAPPTIGRQSEALIMWCSVWLGTHS